MRSLTTETLAWSSSRSASISRAEGWLRLWLCTRIVASIPTILASISTAWHRGPASCGAGSASRSFLSASISACNASW
nr:unnamed protein product [Digitaria exilis]